MTRSTGILPNSAFFVSKVSLLIITLILSCTGNRVTPVQKPVQQIGSIISNAERFALDKESGYTKLTIINPWQGAEGINNIYYLVKRGTSIPSEIDSAQIIFVPLNKIICMSTTYLAMISALHEENTIAGVSGTGFIYEKSLSEKVNLGRIKDIGYEADLNKELIIKISPDLIMMYGIGNESLGYVNKLKELGLKTLFNADYLENDPLGKAEWIKLFGALYCKEELADSIFKSLSETYSKTKIFIKNNITSRPDVMLGLPFRDTWFISPGNSYISTIISDAGGNYLWKDTRSSVSMPSGIENVFLKAMNADYWLNIGNVNSKKEIFAIDARLSEIPCFKNGNLFNNNKRINENGGNDYWESGSLNPHLILKDIASILHPELFKRDELFYYKKIN